MARSPRRSTPSRRPQWLVILTGLVAAVNAIVRLFKLFGSKSRPAKSPAVSPSRAPSPRKTPAASTRTAPAAPRNTTKPPSPAADDGGIPELFRQQRTEVHVTASGIVVKVLPDDLDTSDGSGQHQRFLVELGDRDRTTVKLSINLKFGRVPATEGDRVRFKGDYVFNELGGAVHWLHHDPLRIHEDGWVEFDGKRYG